MFISLNNVKKIFYLCEIFVGENNSGSFTCNPFILNVASENDLVLLINKWYSQSQAENKCRVLLKNSGK